MHFFILKLNPTAQLPTVESWITWVWPITSVFAVPHFVLLLINWRILQRCCSKVWTSRFCCGGQLHVYMLWLQSTEHLRNVNPQAADTQGPHDFRTLRFPEFQENRHMKVVWLSALWTGRLYLPGNIPGTRYAMAPGPLHNWLQLVAQCLNWMRHQTPPI
jgi:hypothetical protein